MSQRTTTRLAQEIAPNLRHTEQRTPEAEKWIAAVSPGEAAMATVEAEVAPRPRPWPSRLLSLFSPSR